MAAYLPLEDPPRLAEDPLDPPLDRPTAIRPTRAHELAVVVALLGTGTRLAALAGDLALPIVAAP